MLKLRSQSGVIVGKIVVLTQRGIKISEWPVNGGGLTIGRAPTNDIQINNPGVSAHHARLVANNEQFILEDLDSRNGTYVNLDRITRKVLQNGDTINFPNCKLKFVLGDDDSGQTYNDFASWWRARKTGQEKAVP